MNPPLIINPPVKSDKPSYQKPENERSRQPRPEPLDVVTERLIVAVRIPVEGVGHVPFPFLVGRRMLVGK